jgi:peptidoglycan/xylan/chitin deacetylase (PgdA/CDA1 family)
MVTGSKSTGSTVARRLVKRASALADRVVPPPAGVTVLLYHRVGGGTAGEVDLDPLVFERHLEHLVAAHDVLTLDAAADRLRPAVDDWTPVTPGRHDRGDAPAVVLTFDDGTRDVTDVVVPALVRHGLPATIYVTTRFVDEQTPFPWGAPPTSWAALRDAASTGLVTVGSHTHEHGLLDRQDPRATNDDLDRSIDLLAEHLGRRPVHFAYPKARPGSPAAEIAVRRRFRTAALAGNRVNRPGRADLHRLRRTPVQRSDGIDDFVRKAAGGHRLEGELRMAVAGIRYRDAER